MNELISNRLQIFINHKRWNKAEFARRMGIYAQDVNRYFEGKLDIQKLIIKLHSEGCNINWLLTGEGEMLTNQAITEHKLQCPHCSNAIKITIEKG